MSEDTKPRLRYSSDGTMIASNDGLKNVISGMGTERDRRTHSQFAYGTGNDIAELEAAYATNWIARQVIDAPVDDATREWRNFSIDEGSEIRKAENALNLQGVTQEAFKWAGLYGGAGVLLITDQPFDKPLDHKRIKKGSLKRLLVLDRMLITGQDYNVSNPMAENYLLPETYLVNGGSQRIHHSHFVRAPGAKLPLRLRMINQGWDDSQLRRCMEDIKDAVSAKSGVASLIQEANVDIISKDGLSDILSSGDMDQAVASRYQLFGMMKSMFRLGLLDSSEAYTRHAASFGGLGEILSTLMEWVSGAAEIPMTRLFGVQSKGMGDSGQGDLNNYYNAIRGKQESDYRQFLEAIDKVLIPSALGHMPDDCEFDWNPLSQPSDIELAQQQLAFAQSDDIRLQQGVVKRSQLMRKLSEQGVYAISDEDIDQAEADEKAERDGEDFIPLAGLEALSAKSTDSDFSEANVKRDNNGKFSAKGGGGSAMPDNLYSHLADLDQEGGQEAVIAQAQVLAEANAGEIDRIRSAVSDLGYSPSAIIAPDKAGPSAENETKVDRPVNAPWSASSPEVAEAIRSIIDADDDFQDFGLRVVPYDQVAEIGETLAKSTAWVNGERTDEELAGTSTIGVGSKGVERAMRMLEVGGYYGTQVVLVAGTRTGSGEDDGEDIISDATVVASWRR